MKIGRISKPLVVQQVRQPLSVAVTVTGNTGSDPTMPLAPKTTQKLNGLTGEYFPDWSSDGSLQLKPLVSAVNPETGGAVTLTPDVRWYIESYIVERESDSGLASEIQYSGGSLNIGNGSIAINPAFEDLLGGDSQRPIIQRRTRTQIQSFNTESDYYLDTSSPDTLIWRKNLNGGSNVVLVCVVAYTDTNLGMPITKEVYVTLSCQNIATDEYSIQILSPVTLRYDPLRDNVSVRTLTAKVYKGTEELSATEDVAVFWYADNQLITDTNAVGDTSHPDDEGVFMGYVSGQGTDVLTVDAAYFKHSVITARFAFRDSTQQDYPVIVDGNDEPVLMPQRATVTVLWKIPRLRCDVLPMRGHLVRTGDTKKSYRIVMKANGNMLDDSVVDSKMRVSWLVKRNNASEQQAGIGRQVDIAVSSLLPSGTQFANVSADVSVLSPLLPVTDKENNPKLVTHNGAFVVGGSFD